MSALTVPLAVLGIALTVPLYAYGVRRLLGLRPSGTRPGPLYLIRGLRKRARRVRRYSQISGILIRHGMLPYLRGSRRRLDRTGARRDAQLRRPGRRQGAAA